MWQKMMLLLVLAGSIWAEEGLYVSGFQTSSRINESNSAPLDIRERFAMPVRRIYVSGWIHNARADTPLEIRWFYHGEKGLVLVHRAKMTAEGSSRFFSADLRAESKEGIPEGNFSVMLVSGDLALAKKRFSIGKFVEKNATVAAIPKKNFQSKVLRQIAEKAKSGLNESEVFNSLVKACENNQSKECLKLGMVYEEGSYLPPDTRVSAWYYYKACQQGEGAACRRLATQYYYGEGVVKSKPNALWYLRRGCTLRDPKSCYYLAKQYMHGKEIRKDPESAEKLYRYACKHGVMGACTSLADLLYRRSKSDRNAAAEMIQLYRKACRAGVISYCGDLGVEYIRGRNVAKNLSKAHDLFDYACRKGDYASCTNLGVMYIRGAGVEVNRELAQQYFDYACQHGYKRACPKRAPSGRRR